jgi:hypothetical protein
MRSQRVLTLACVVVLTASSSAFAQRWGYGRLPRSGACFYKDADFRGEYFCVDAGDSLNSIPGDMNDKISSVRLYGGAEVTVFKDSRFNGRSTHFPGDVRNLKNAGWNDTISSLQVRARGYRSGLSSMDADRIVRRAYDDLLEREPDQAGLRLYRSRIIDDGWTEAQVRDALRKSPEYREKTTMTYPKAQEIVRRAYQNVLKREPDAGASGYVNHVMRDKWTQADVERELRKSPEYRNKR